jgi:parvulin-like peptidyl-prolyl isomerase
MRLLLLLLIPLLLPGAASCSASEGGSDAPAVEATAKDPVTALREDIAALQAKPEHSAARVKVQHILIGFQGAPRMTATRSQAEAEALAADILVQLKAGADFTRLMSEHSDDDKVVGQYLMSATEPTRGNTLYNRHGMVPAFGDVGWRLAVGEIGVAPHDPKASPFGWHIVKRLE